MKMIFLCLFVLSIEIAAGVTLRVGNFANDSNISYQRNYVKEITPHANTAWGNWGPAVFCPEQAFARDFELKVIVISCSLQIQVFNVYIYKFA